MVMYRYVLLWTYGNSDDSHFLDLKGAYFIWLHVPWLYDNGYHNPLP